MTENRLGVLAILVSSENEVLLIPGGKENNNKKERVVNWHDSFREAYGDEFPAGAVEIFDIVYCDEVDWVKLALMREIAEETGMIVSPDQLIENKGSMLVEQVRDGLPASFVVASYWLALNDEQQSWLISQGAKPYQLSQHVRPRDEAVIGTWVPNRVDMGVMVNAE